MSLHEFINSYLLPTEDEEFFLNVSHALGGQAGEGLGDGRTQIGVRLLGQVEQAVEKGLANFDTGLTLRLKLN